MSIIYSISIKRTLMSLNWESIMEIKIQQVRGEQ